jgi:hypothetical protein
MAMRAIPPAIRSAIAISALALAGCTYNPYQHHYEITIPPMAVAGVEPCEGPIEVTTPLNLKQGTDELYRNGYVPIGRASFEDSDGDATEANAGIGALVPLQLPLNINTSPATARRRA